ncbi:MAG: peroxidase-related enzyme [Gammaproteobacteria bacterium]
MPNIKPLDPTKADTRTAETLAKVKRKLGVLPNLFTTLANAPAALNGYLQFGEALAGGRLSAQQRELIAVAVAQQNACGYCLSAHTAIGKGVGVTEEQLNKARHGSASNAKDAAILGFAQRVARDRGNVAPSELEALRKLGIDDGLIVEIVAHVALNVLTNYVNLIAGTEIDFPRVDLSVAA